MSNALSRDFIVTLAVLFEKGICYKTVIDSSVRGTASVTPSERRSESDFIVGFPAEERGYHAVKRKPQWDARRQM